MRTTFRGIHGRSCRTTITVESAGLGRGRSLSLTLRFVDAHPSAAVKLGTSLPRRRYLRRVEGHGVWPVDVVQAAQLCALRARVHLRVLPGVGRLGVLHVASGITEARHVRTSRPPTGLQVHVTNTAICRLRG